VTLEGEAEKQLIKGFDKKRIHDEIMGKIDALGAFAANKNSVVFGNQ